MDWLFLSWFYFSCQVKHCRCFLFLFTHSIKLSKIPYCVCNSKLQSWFHRRALGLIWNSLSGDLLCCCFRSWNSTCFMIKSNETNILHLDIQNIIITDWKIKSYFLLCMPKLWFCVFVPEWVELRLKQWFLLIPPSTPSEFNLCSSFDKPGHLVFLAWDAGFTMGCSKLCAWSGPGSPHLMANSLNSAHLSRLCGLGSLFLPHRSSQLAGQPPPLPPPHLPSSHCTWLQPQSHSSLP